MKIMGYMVIVRVPDNLQTHEVSKEIETSIGFGHAQVTAVFQFPDLPAVSKVLPRHTEQLAHDGFATHSHEVRPDHLGVHRKEWGDNV